MACENCEPADCQCPVLDMSTDCSTYDGTTVLSDIGTNPGTVLTQVLININSSFTNLKNSLSGYFTVLGVGTGAQVFGGVTGAGAKRIRSIIGGTNITAIENTDDITLNVPPASETVLGAIEIATQAEVDAQTDATKAVTPLTLGTTLATGGYFPIASTTVQGIIEIATQSETDFGSDVTRAVTPGTLAPFVSNPTNLPSATETTQGISERATQAEAQALTDATRFLTPLTLSSVTATEVRKGIAEVATTAEVTTGTDDTRMVTPLKLKQRLDVVVPTNTSDLTNDGDGINDFATVDQIAFVNKAVAMPYTLLPGDRGSVLYTTGTGNLTIPTGLGADFECGIIQADTGVVTVVASGTTVLIPSDLTNTIKGQHYQIYVRKSPTSETFNIIGNLTSV